MMSLICSIGRSPASRILKGRAKADRRAPGTARRAREKCSPALAWRAMFSPQRIRAARRGSGYRDGTSAARSADRGGRAMKCTDIMSKNLEWLTEKDTVLKAAAIMAEAGVGFLPICDARRRVIGVVTDRDLAIRALAKKVAADSTSA